MKLSYSKAICLSLLLLYNAISLCAQLPLKYEQNIAPSYEEVIDMYKQLEIKFPLSRLIEAGQTDIGKKLHLFIISRSKIAEPSALHENGKVVLLIK